MRRVAAVIGVGLVLCSCALIRDLDQYESGDGKGGAAVGGNAGNGGASGSGAATSGGGTTGDGGSTSGGAAGGGGAAGAEPCSPPCSGSADLCDPIAKKCVECLVKADCPSFNPLCDTTGHCVDCLGDGDCGGSTPKCLNGHCEQCIDNGDCETNQSCHTGSHRCQPKCGSSADCTTSMLPLCLTSMGVCVECLSSNDCTLPEKCESSSNTCND